MIRSDIERINKLFLDHDFTVENDKYSYEFKIEFGYSPTKHYLVLMISKDDSLLTLSGHTVGDDEDMVWSAKLIFHPGDEEIIIISGEEYGLLQRTLLKQFKFIRKFENDKKIKERKYKMAYQGGLLKNIIAKLGDVA